MALVAQGVAHSNVAQAVVRRAMLRLTRVLARVWTLPGPVCQSSGASNVVTEIKVLMAQSFSNPATAEGEELRIAKVKIDDLARMFAFASLAAAAA